MSLPRPLVKLVRKTFGVFAGARLNQRAKPHCNLIGHVHILDIGTTRVYRLYQTLPLLAKGLAPRLKIHRVLYEGQVDNLVRRFEEECRLLSELRHPHIVQFLGVYFEADTNAPVLVMEFLPTTLSQRLDRYGAMPEEINYSVLEDVAVGLRYLHDRRDPIIHRDLSANNVLLTPDMKAKISDLGVAKIVGGGGNRGGMSTMTKTPGTQCYMPPETMVARPRYDIKVNLIISPR